MKLSGKKAVIAPEGVFIIGTYDENGTANAMNAAWGMQSDLGEITLMLSEHQTTKNFEKTNAFTVAFATVETVAESDYFGIESGKNVDKIKKVGFHTHKAELVNAPVIEEYPITMECLVRSWDPETGYLIGEIVSEVVDDKVLTNGKIDFTKFRPIVFDISEKVYRTIGDVVGKAFSDGMVFK